MSQGSAYYATHSWDKENSHNLGRMNDIRVTSFFASESFQN